MEGNCRVKIVGVKKNISMETSGLVWPSGSEPQDSSFLFDKEIHIHPPNFRCLEIRPYESIHPDPSLWKHQTLRLRVAT